MHVHHVRQGAQVPFKMHMNGKASTYFWKWHSPYNVSIFTKFHVRCSTHLVGMYTWELAPRRLCCVLAVGEIITTWSEFDPSLNQNDDKNGKSNSSMREVAIFPLRAPLRDSVGISRRVWHLTWIKVLLLGFCINWPLQVFPPPQLCKTGPVMTYFRVYFCRN